MAEPKKDFKKDDKKFKPKPGGPWGMILVIVLVAAALGKLGIGGEGNSATSTATSTPQNKPTVTIGQ